MRGVSTRAKGETMYKLTRLLASALASLTLVALGATAAPAGAQPEAVAVDYGACAFGGGTATVPAGIPITVQDTGGFAEGTYGLALTFVQHTAATATIAITGGATSTLQLSFSDPAYYGDPYYAWLAFLPDIALAPLASGGSVLVTINTSVTQPVEVVFPGQRGRFHFGPFHLGAGDGFETSCLITASTP
jgi:hypothetical protein